MQTVVSEEKHRHDDIFTTLNNNNPVAAMNNTPSSNKDIYYDKPDMEVYFFKNCKSNILCIKDGMPMSVRQNNGMDENFIDKLTSKSKGVFIVRYFHYRPDTNNAFLSKFINSTVLDTGYGEEIDTITQKKLRMFLTRHTNSAMPLRFVTFIPEDQILHKGIYKDVKSNTKLVSKDLEIVDFSDDVSYDTNINISLSGGKQKCYYLALGRDVIPIYTKPNIHGKFHGEITITSNDVVVEENKLEHNKLEEYGLHASEESAHEYIDIDKRLDIRTQEFKLSTLENDIQLANITLENKIATIAFDKIKRNSELNMLTVKLEQEKMKLIQTQLPMFKSALALGFKVLTKIAI